MTGVCSSHRTVAHRGLVGLLADVIQRGGHWSEGSRGEAASLYGWGTDHLTRHSARPSTYKQRGEQQHYQLGCQKLGAESSEIVGEPSAVISESSPCVRFI